MHEYRHAGNSNVLYIPVSTGALKGDKSLKMSSDSISESVIFQNFLGGMPPDAPSIGMLCMPVCFAQYL